MPLFVCSWPGGTAAVAPKVLVPLGLMSGPGGMGPCPELLALVNSSWPHGAAGCCGKTPALAPRSLGTARAQQLTPSRASVSPSLPAGRAQGEHLAVSPLLSLLLTRPPSPGSTAGGIQSLGRTGAGWAPAPPGTKPGWRRAAGCGGAAGHPVVSRVMLSRSLVATGCARLLSGSAGHPQPQHSRIRTRPKWKDASPSRPVAGHNPNTARI